jgi:biopolymer transport protein TolQ
MLFGSGLFELLSSLGLIAQVILLILLAFSVVSWTLILYKWRFFREQEAADHRFVKAFGRYEYPLDAAVEVTLHRDSGVAAVYGEVARRYQSAGNGGDAMPTRQYVERVLGSAVQDRVTRAEAYLPFLATTGNITPFIGLLGTVIGIIDAFREIGIQGTASIVAVAPGVAEALVATAAGLFAAIPAVIAYNYFLGRVRTLAVRLDRFAIELTNALEMRGIREPAGQP